MHGFNLVKAAFVVVQRIADTAQMLFIQRVCMAFAFDFFEAIIVDMFELLPRISQRVNTLHNFLNTHVMYLSM